MPKEISHIYFSEEIQKGLRPEIQNILRKDTKIFIIMVPAPLIYFITIYL
jgi:hypothetical protein